MKFFVALVAASSLAFSSATDWVAPQASQRIEADTVTLAADDMEGRKTGTEGYARAADHVEQRMREIGLAPGGFNDTYREPVRLHHIAEDTELAASFTVDGKTYEHGDNAIIRVDPLRAPIRGTTGLVFVGDGFDAPEYGGSSYANVDVRGKVVVAMVRDTEGLEPDVGAHLGSARARIAAQNGAVGFISIMPRGIPVFAWQRYMDYFNGERFLPEYDSQAGLAFAASIRPEDAAALFDGSGTSLATLERKLKASGRLDSFALDPNVSVDLSAPAAEIVSSDTVIGVIEGSDPELADEIVVVTAHLDHMGVDEDRSGDQIFNGAYDNAVGVASILESARAILARDEKPRRSIAFVALAAEEQGLFGSQQMAKRGTIAGKTIVANVNLDMPMLFGDFDQVIAFGAHHSDIGDAVNEAARAMGLTQAEDPDPEQAYFVRSDHYSFVLEGVPSVMIDPFNAAKKAEADRFMGNHYHKVSDETDLDIDYYAAARFAEIGARVTYTLAMEDEAPEWKEDSYFGSWASWVRAIRAARQGG
ncbi:M28 family peptidase [Sphingomicrobium sediminis]|uniref:M20/M25/M40 family metallo-hydrolase n=1 Tax=Sphingomicrobium sediminis TaxID=2950949 RepID=A0A9X2EHU0_9SPHN|nr:M28 family peptidase [Sphingomicrobium sediminis]MCM8557827.1 M20/M25/M40 family metallo-hydrolase [Sphingomicrobium sediminis]